MNMFSERLKELIKYNGITVIELSRILGMKDTSMIYYWLRNDCLPKLDYSLKIADYFKISLDYLFGKSDDFSKNKFKETQPFHIQLRNVLNANKISQYKLVKDGVCNFANFYNWFNRKSTPKMEGLIKLSDYLGVSLDYLVGRE